MRVSISDVDLKEAFSTVRDDPAFEESSALVARGGRPAEMIQAMALRPAILRAFGQTGACVYPGGLLERRLKEFVIIAASIANRCQFCTDSHVALTAMLGLSDDPRRAVDQPGSMTDRERLALEYTRAAMADSNRIPDQLFTRIKANFSDAEVVELTFLIGFINMLNLFNNCLQVTYRGEYATIAAGARRTAAPPPGAAARPARP
jgi:AhpD family alkylhydroperoxidase